MYQIIVVVVVVVVYNAHILTEHNACNIIRWWLSGKCKAHLADNRACKDGDWQVFTCRIRMSLAL